MHAAWRQAFQPHIIETWETDPGDLLPPGRQLQYMCSDVGTSWWDGPLNLALRPCREQLETQRFEVKRRGLR